MGIKYIFCINSGRSGSDYLSKLFAHARNTFSVREGFPIMNGFPMQQFNSGSEAELNKLMPIKLKEIQKKSRNGHKVYCETNHSFIKGWGYLLPDNYIPQEEIGVIILRRDVDETVRSLLRIRDVPGSCEWTRTWQLAPNSERNISNPPKGANYFELCKWHVEETYLRAEKYRSLFPKIQYVDCNLDRLNEYDFVMSLFNKFGLLAKDSLKKVIGKPSNPKSEWPKLTLEVLMEGTSYASADELNGEERHQLIIRMLSYIQANKSEKIAQAKPDFTTGSFIRAAIEIVADVERELENFYEYSLIFTETESILIFELLRLMNSDDIFFIFCKRVLLPYLQYNYDFNKIPSIFDLVKQVGMIQTFSMVLRGV